MLAIMEDLWKLESVELSESGQFVSKLTQRLRTNRDPALLGDLVDYYFKNGSKRARKVLTSLRETHSQDYFDKLYDSIQKTSTRLPVLKLLAHTLNSETSWLYRIVDHPLFSAILDQLKLSDDIIVLCSGLFVVTALLPLVPSYISKHLTSLFAVFCSLATIKHTNRLGQTPQELYLHLSVAVYYFFLQLYALFPNNFFDYLRREYGNNGQEANMFAESIAPFFNLVQLHPSLVVGGGSYELSTSKWRSMEPEDIATLSLQLCLDKHLATQEPNSGPWSSFHPEHPWKCPQQTSCTSPKSVAGLLQTPTPSNTTQLSGVANPGGLKPSEELDKIISPFQALSSATPHYSNNISPNDSSRSSVNFLTQPSLQASAISSPLSDSALSSTAPTPRGATGSKFIYKNYSPTASIDSDPLASRITQSAVHGPLEDSLSGFPGDPLSQSMRVDSTAPPRKRKMGAQNHSIKNRVGKFIGMFVSKTAKADVSSGGSDDFTEIHASELEQSTNTRVENSVTEQSPTPVVQAPGTVEEVGEECVPDSAKESPKVSKTSLKLTAASLRTSQPQSVPSSRHSRSDSCSSLNGRVASQYSDVHNKESSPGKDCDVPMHFSFSYPERGPSEMKVKRVRNSNSEASTTQTVMMVQERLKELVEINQQRMSTSIEKPLSSSTPTEGEYDSSTLHTMDLSTESRATILAQTSDTQSPDINRSTPVTLSLNFNTSSDKPRPSLTPVSTSLPANSADSGSANTLGVDLANCLLVKRVSVSSKKERNQFSDSGTQSTHAESLPAMTGTDLSPLALLDQYVSRGVVLHKGHFETIPLTELEGVDWNHFGGCPHSEEFGMMQAQVVLLHSQLMFERYQCMQHARRNRTLLSQARSASKVKEELQTLKEEVQNLTVCNQSLQSDLQRKTLALTNSTVFQGTLKAQNQALFSENNSLKEKNQKLAKDVRMLEELNRQLQKKLDHSLHVVTCLENDQADFQSRLQRAESCGDKVEQLSRELQTLGDLYYQSKQAAVCSLNHDPDSKEGSEMVRLLSREKEDGESRLYAMKSHLAVLSARAQEVEKTLSKREDTIQSLQEQLRQVEGNYQKKLKALEDKYRSMKTICLQLENTVLELRGRGAPVARKKRHKRSSSHPAGGQCSEKPLPSQYQTSATPPYSTP